MRPTLWVIATPARAVRAPWLLIPTPALSPPWGETVEETATHVILIVLPWARIFHVLVAWELFAIRSSVEEVPAVGIPE
jgi:hypothetical protein